MGVLVKDDHSLVAMGSYSGTSACAVGAEKDAICVAALKQCGVAIAESQAHVFSDKNIPLQRKRHSFCADEQRLSIDIDLDGRWESFLLSSFVNERGVLVEEVFLDPRKTDTDCKKIYSHRSVGESGAFNILGVFDFNRDGRLDVLLSFEREGERHWGIFSPQGSAGRLLKSVEKKL